MLSMDANSTPEDPQDEDVVKAFFELYKCGWLKTATFSIPSNIAPILGGMFLCGFAIHRLAPQRPDEELGRGEDERGRLAEAA